MSSSSRISRLGAVLTLGVFALSGCTADDSSSETGGGEVGGGGGASSGSGVSTTGAGGTTGTSASTSAGDSSSAATGPSGTSGSTGSGDPGLDPLRGYWVWEKRVQGTVEQSGNVDNGQMKLAFGTGNDECHYIWNETTGSDFHTECTYSVSGDMVSFVATSDPDGTAAGYSCAHPDWTVWNDRPALQWGRYKFEGDRLWIGVNSYWGFGGGVTTSDGSNIPSNGSLKRFPFWESEGQAVSEESWIVFMPVTRDAWYTTYAISTNCQGSADLCAQWPGCGPGDKGYVD